MHLGGLKTDGLWYQPIFTSFTCENDQKAFYKIVEDCLRFPIKNPFVIYVNTPGSAGC